MSSTSLAELAGLASALSGPECGQLHSAKSTSGAALCSGRDGPALPFSRMCEPPTSPEPTSSAAASPAKTLALPESAPALPGSVRDSIGRSYEPFAWYDPSSRSWRTWQRCLVSEWAEFLEMWPRTGLMRNGIAFRLATLGRPTGVTAFGSPLPTPTSSSGRSGAARALDGGSGARKKLERLATPTVCGNWNRQGCSETSGDGLMTQLVRELGGPITGKKSLRRFVEWMMGFPQDHTDLSSPTPSNDSEMQSPRRSRKSGAAQS